jgi:UDP-glucuronate 4-epimerase
MKVLVTGAAGFIGFHVVKRLLERDHMVVGLDNINDYYDVNLKFGRLHELGIPREKIKERILVNSETEPHFGFVRLDAALRVNLDEVFRIEQFDLVCHLAAQAGVRYSLKNPHAYIDSNIVAFMNVLEACRCYRIKHLVYASSSSVYGLNQSMPFSTHDNVDHPLSLYAATKKANELMAHTYSHLYGLPTTGLRFFTVYGPWGRPDMALFLFTRSILAGTPIDVYNEGRMKRDFTYIDDIVEGVVRALDSIPAGNPEWSGKHPDPATSPDPYRIYNIGNGHPVNLLDFIGALEETLGRKALKNFLPLQPGDVPATWADIKDLDRDLNYKPRTDIRTGIQLFIDWYRKFYGVKR